MRFNVRFLVISIFLLVCFVLILVISVFHIPTSDKTANGEIPSYSQHLISNFGEDEYECYGSCFCETERRSSAAISRGLVTMLFAVSSVVAVGKATKYFDEECKSLVSSDECPEHMIFSEVQVCQNPDDKEITGSEEEVELDRVRGGEEHYFCSGGCISNSDHLLTYLENVKMLTGGQMKAVGLFMKNLACDQGKVSGEVTLQTDSLYAFSGEKEEYMKQRVAISKFLRKYLTKEFCDKQFPGYKLATVGRFFKLFVWREMPGFCKAPAILSTTRLVPDMEKELESGKVHCERVVE